MKNTIRAPLSVLIFIMALIMANSVFAQTEADFLVDLTADGTGVVITGFTGNQRQVRIPATIQGFPVREIGERAFSPREWSEITSVTIPAGVVKIGAGAFSECQSLTTVSIPASVTIIEYGAFGNCEKLTTINFPEGLIEIGTNAFFGCHALRTVRLPNSLIKLGEDAFSMSNHGQNAGIQTLTIGTGLTEIPNRAFSGNSFTTIVIPQNITKIGVHAFANCDRLATVTINSTVLEIMTLAFHGCAALTTINIPAALESITWTDSNGNPQPESLAFAGCPRIALATRAVLQRLGYRGSY